MHVRIDQRYVESAGKSGTRSVAAGVAIEAALHSSFTDGRDMPKIGGTCKIAKVEFQRS